MPDHGLCPDCGHGLSLSEVKQLECLECGFQKEPDYTSERAFAVREEERADGIPDWWDGYLGPDGDDYR